MLVSEAPAPECRLLFIGDPEPISEFLTRSEVRDAIRKTDALPSSGVLGSRPIACVSVWFHEGCSAARLFASEAQSFGLKCFLHENRRFLQRHREKASWLWITSSTTGVLVDLHEQRWCPGADCDRCGAGSTPEQPLILKAANLPKGGVAIEPRTGALIVDDEILAGIRAGGLRGFDVHPALKTGRTRKHRGLHWIKPHETWPLMQSGQGWSATEVCPHCQRCGFNSVSDEEFNLVYSDTPATSADFGRTSEEWGGPWSRDDRFTGGQPRMLASSRAYRLFRSMCSRISMDPVLFESAGAGGASQ